MTKLRFIQTPAARPEWSSFCEEARRAKKRERRADIAAQLILL